MAKTARTFHIYRFQILPTFSEKDFDLYFPPQFEIKSVEELASKKNQLFANALRKEADLKHSWATLTHQLYEVDDFFVLKIGANRGLVRITKDFVEEVLDNWPSAYVLINNDPDVQLMAIELEPQAFDKTSTVVNILTANINERLEKYRLSLEISPVTSVTEFWKIIKANEKRVTRVEFFMIAPNLANISKTLGLDLKELRSQTNSLRTNLSLEAPPGETLTLSEDDSFTKSLVDYSSKGGGTAHVKIKGYKKLVKTEDNIRTLEVDEIYFSGDNAEKVAKQLLEQLRKDIEE